MVLRRAGAFAGSWSLDAAAAVCDGDSLDVLDALSSLVEKSLVVVDVERGRTRYRLLESTRAYALEKLSIDGEASVAALRVARWMAAFCDDAADTHWSMPLAPWLARTGDELDNARAVIEWACASPERIEIALRVGSGLGGLWRFGGMREAGARLLDAALALGGTVSPALEARAWRELAWIGVGTRTLAAAERAVALDEARQARLRIRNDGTEDARSGHGSAALRRKREPAACAPARRRDGDGR
jgi:hypothetical protein